MARKEKNMGEQQSIPDAQTATETPKPSPVTEAPPVQDPPKVVEATPEPTQSAAAPAPTPAPKALPAPETAIVAPPQQPVERRETDDRPILPFMNEASFQAALRMANALASSSMVPVQYQGQKNIPNVLIAMEMASRIGASIFQVMQNGDVIYGNFGWRAKFLIATVNTSGRFTPIKYEWKGTRGKGDWGCRAYAFEKRTGERLDGAWVDWDMVVAEKWHAKPGSKWLSMPELMFQYRSCAFWTRAYSPETGLGMHTAEEWEDTGDARTPVAIKNGDAKALEAELLAKPGVQPVAGA